jgi:hypothetical protein
VCGDAAAAQLADFRIKVARDDEGDPGPLTTVATGRFGPADLGEARDVRLSGATTGVRYVQLQALSNHGDRFFMDVAELQIFGHTTAPEEGGGGTAAPAVTTLPADPAVTTASTVTFRAAVRSNGSPTVVRVAYGLASGQLAYQTADVPVSGNAPQTIGLAAGGLLPNTTYHYRAIATNARGTVTGDELTVTTTAAGTPSQPPVSNPAPTAASGKRGAAGNRRAAVTCRMRRPRTVTCTFAERPSRTARVRLSRDGRTLARGVLRGRVLQMRARRPLRAGSYILTITQGHGRSTTIKRRAIRL